MVNELCSGPCLVLEIQGPDTPQTFRELCGPADPVSLSHHVFFVVLFVCFFACFFNVSTRLIFNLVLFFFNQHKLPVESEGATQDGTIPAAADVTL